MRYMPIKHEMPLKSKKARTFKASKFKIASVALIMIFLFFAYREIFVFGLFCIITAIITYYSKLYHFPIDVSPLFFLQIVITRFFSFKLTLLYIGIGYVIPKVAAGSGMKWESYAFISVALMANLVSIPLKSWPLLWVGGLASLILYVGGIFIGMISKPFFLAAADGVANTLNNLIWFLIFSDVIVWILG